MSIAGDILRGAIDQQRELHAKTLAEMQERSAALNDAIREPWRARVEAIGQAVALVNELVKPKVDDEHPPDASTTTPAP